MQHWLTALIAPLFELNPIEYATSKTYRRKKDYQLGRRAKRILAYQCVIFVIWVVVTAAAIERALDRF